MWPFRNKWKDRALQAETAIEGWQDASDEWRDKFRASDTRCGALERALESIAEQETASANATVKRMAKIAREALASGAEKPVFRPDGFPALKTEVDAGPPPQTSSGDNAVLLTNLRLTLTGECPVISAFRWDTSAQGLEYWHDQCRNGLTREGRAIIEAWITKLEKTER